MLRIATLESSPEREPITGPMVERAYQDMRADAGMGADWWAPWALKQTSEESTSEHASILDTMEEQHVFPHGKA